MLLLPATPVLCQLGFAAGLCGAQAMAVEAKPAVPPCHAESEAASSKTSESESETPTPECCTLLSMPATEAPAEALQPIVGLWIVEPPVETEEARVAPPTFASLSHTSFFDPDPPPLFTLHSSLLL